MDDMEIYNVGFVLAASKRTSYRKEVIETYNIYFRFLQDNGLTTRILLGPDELPTADTKVMQSDLTEEGDEFIRRAEQKWFGATDRGMSPENSTLLEKELAKLRSKK